MMRSSG
jgi:hypothetical protein